jgi:hypothetical protein
MKTADAFANLATATTADRTMLAKLSKSNNALLKLLSTKDTTIRYASIARAAPVMVEAAVHLINQVSVVITTAITAGRTVGTLPSPTKVRHAPPQAPAIKLKQLDPIPWVAATAIKLLLPDKHGQLRQRLIIVLTILALSSLVLVAPLHHQPILPSQTPDAQGISSKWMHLAKISLHLHWHLRQHAQQPAHLCDPDWFPSPSRLPTS